MMNVVTPNGTSCRTLDRLRPDTGPVRIHFTISVGAYTPAGTVAQILRAAHRTGQSGRMENTLPAHPAVEQSLLADFLDRQDETLKYFCGSGIL